MKNKIIYSILILLIIILGFSSIYFYHLIDINNDTITYNVLDDSSYIVYYKENTFLGGKTTNKSYLKKYLDKIIVNFDYKINLSKRVKSKSSYLVRARVVVNAPNSDNILWESNLEYLLPEMKETYNSTKMIKQQSKVQINYGNYLAIYEQFKNETSIISNAKIVVEFISNSTINNGKDINENNIVSYEIPLSDDVFSINKINNSSINKTKMVNNNSKYQDKYTIMFMVDMGLLVIMLLLTVYYYYKSKTQNYYRNTLNKILKTYDSIIVNIKSLPVMKKNTIVEVDSFEELVDAEIELKVPINYYERVKGKKAIFFIMNNNIIWLYKLEESGNNYERK